MNKLPIECFYLTCVENWKVTTVNDVEAQISLKRISEEKKRMADLYGRT
jgi:hypothetical protein